MARPLSIVEVAIEGTQGRGEMMFVLTRLGEDARRGMGVDGAVQDQEGKLIELSTYLTKL